jgi:hypothetical protein
MPQRSIYIKYIFQATRKVHKRKARLYVLFCVHVPSVKTALPRKNQKQSRFCTSAALLCKGMYRSRIHERIVSLRLLGVICEFSDLRFSYTMFT